MCKYSYISGACANRHVESTRCIGENDCEFSGTNILGSAADAGTDPLAEEWHQLYCEAHGRYLCPQLQECPRPRTSQRSRVSIQQRKLEDDWKGVW